MCPSVPVTSLSCLGRIFDKLEIVQEISRVQRGAWGPATPTPGPVHPCTNLLDHCSFNSQHFHLYTQYMFIYSVIPSSRHELFPKLPSFLIPQTSHSCGLSFHQPDLSVELRITYWTSLPRLVINSTHLSNMGLIIYPIAFRPAYSPCPADSPRHNCVCHSSPVGTGSSLKAGPVLDLSLHFPLPARTVSVHSGHSPEQMIIPPLL